MAVDVQSLAEEAIDIFRPLGSSFRDPAALSRLLARLGFDRTPEALAGVAGALAPFVAQIDKLVESGDADSLSLDQVLGILAAVVELQAALPDAIQKLASAGVPAAVL